MICRAQQLKSCFPKFHYKLVNIRYVPYLEIDKIEWDRCIDRSANTLIYAKAFYLDAMAGNWDALVLDNYEAVMPLTLRKKWGISYLYQPAFTQQLGVFFSGVKGSEIVEAFLAKAASYFKFIEINLNFQNRTSQINGSLSARNNFVIPLSKSYEEKRLTYPGFTLKHLKRAVKANLKYEVSTDYIPVVELYKKLYHTRMLHITNDDFKNFSAVCKRLVEQHFLAVRNVLDDAGEIMAAGIFLMDSNRIYNMASCITQQGKKLQANYFLFDELIREFSNSTLLLDLEGSDLKGIADFYNHFAPENQPYYFYKVNNLSPLLKLVKK